MSGIGVIVGFVGMILAPCAVAIYGKLERSSESEADAPAAHVAGTEPLFEALLPPNEITVKPHHQTPPHPSFSGPVPVASLHQVAEWAARDAIEAQAAAANARAEALQQASRAASQRAAAAEKLSAAAESELVRASQAVVQAEASKAQARLIQDSPADRDYLPPDHPSLDFPRSRTPSRRVA